MCNSRGRCVRKPIRVGYRPRVTIVEPEDGDDDCINRIDEGFIESFPKANDRLRADIKVLAKAKDAEDGAITDDFLWTITDLSGPRSITAPGDTKLNFFGTCGCRNEATVRVTVTDSDGNKDFDEYKYCWFVGCDPDGGSKCNPDLCPAGCF